LSKCGPRDHPHIPVMTPKKLLSILIFHKLCDLHSSTILHSVQW